MIKLAVVALPILFAGILWGAVGMAATAVFVALLLGLWVTKRAATVHVPEMEIGVVFNTQTHSFARFLRPGHHPINPFTERLQATIPTTSGAAKGRCTGVQTAGGLSLNVEWSLSYDLDPFKAPVASHAKLARSLPHKSARMAAKHMDNCLHHVIGEYTITQLCQPGIHKRLERQVRQLLAARLASSGFEISRVMIGAIEMPPPVKAALEAAHERQVQLDNEVETLARLHQAVSRFSEADMERLVELERIYKMGQNGVTLVYPTAVSPSPARESASNAKNSYTRFAASSAVVAPGLS